MCELLSNNKTIYIYYEDMLVQVANIRFENCIQTGKSEFEL